jgi:trimethylamine--corrinoid protein Co-methyltransferase
MNDAQPSPQRRGRSARRSERQAPRPDAAGAVRPGLPGGRYLPLSQREVERTHGAVLHLLEKLGLSQAPRSMIDLVTARGGRLSEDGRLSFPPALVEEMIARARRDLVLHGRRPGLELEVHGARVHTGTGGGAPTIMDLETGVYRPSTATDLYDAARLVDRLDHIHLFSRPLVCTDAPDPLSLDVNTAYACLAGTAKHVCMSISAPENVAAVAALCHELAGGERAFRAAPLLTVMATHVVPPLRFATEACEVVEQAVRHGLPVQLISAGQMGATSPVTLAGSLVQAVAESLAGMVFAWLVDPEAAIIFAPKPLVSDLRTGAMCGGGGEQAVLMAAAAQMGRHYDLPTSSIAGYSDSKVHDAQAGYEKNLSVTLAAHAGCNIITHASGTLASMLGCSLESFVIDNDMLGGILRSLRGVEVDDDTVATQVIEDVVRGEGHYLGHPQTLARMESDYVYPQIADRQPPDAWLEAGGEDMLQRGRAQARQILAEHHPSYLPRALDDDLRARFDILVPRDAMGP